jgi:glyoxylase-like metal-dependent hydrolase (beta-lactamase superfamily II)
MANSGKGFAMLFESSRVHSRLAKRALNFSALFVFIALQFLSDYARAAVGDVGTYTSPQKTFSTASYWIEGVDGVVMIETQFLPKEGLLAVREAEKATGKKVVAAIVLHPNPDKFNGTAAYQAGGIKVLASRQTIELIPSVHDIRLGWFFDEYSPDYPKLAAKPTEFGSNTTELNIAGIRLTLHVLGKGASGAHVVVQYKSHLFVGDLINPSNHAWLELGYVSEWLNRLNELKALGADKIYPGRGIAGGAELITNQANYLSNVRTWVRTEKQNSNAKELGFFTKRKLQSKIEDAYPQLGYKIFMRDGLAAVWKNEQ